MIQKAELSGAYFIVAAFWLLVLPVRLVLAAVAAAIMHELCHLLAIRLTGGRVLGVRIGAGGMTLETGPMTVTQELFCALAGPAGSYLLALLHPWAPWVAVCAMIQGTYNLLPLYPLDGGRCLRCLLELLFSKNWVKLWRAVQWTMLVALGLAGVGLAWALEWGIWPVLLWVLVLVRKIPCKEGELRVQ